MERDEYIKELRKLYKLAMDIQQVDVALELLERIRKAGESITVSDD